MSSTPEEFHIERGADGYEFRVVYLVDQTPQTVWSMLTEADKLCEWLAPGHVEAHTGGRACIDFQDSGIPIDSIVSVAEPPRLLAYSWGDANGPERPLRWEIDPVGDGARLALNLQLPADEDAAKACAGWDAHLQMLLASLEGVSIHFPVDHFLAVRDRCRADLSG